jgi:hypothetical protein
MTKQRPPRLAFWLLDTFVDDDALAGDLQEEFAVRRSRWWLWRQVIVSLVLAARRTPREIRPLRLVERESELANVPVFSRRDVNITGSPIYGIGGLGLAILGALVSIVSPATWILALGAVIGGVLLGLVRIQMQRAHH